MVEGVAVCKGGGYGRYRRCGFPPHFLAGRKFREIIDGSEREVATGESAKRRGKPIKGVSAMEGRPG